MFNAKKKRAAKLEAEKDAARKAMEEAGLDLGHEAAKVAAKTSKAEAAVAAKVDAAKEAKETAEAKSSRKTGDMKRKMAETKMKLSGKTEVGDEEAARRKSEYEPWRLVVKDMKPEWKSLAEKARTLANALEADQQSMRELTEVLCTNAAADRTRLLLDAEVEQGAKGVAVPPIALFAKRPPGAGKFRAALWREPTWQVLARCNAGGVDCADAYKLVIESFAPVNAALSAGHKGVGEAELIKRKYWDSCMDGDNARYNANHHARDIAKAAQRREKNEEKALKLMADGKAKQAAKLLKADDSMAAQLEGKKLSDEADRKNKLSIEYERAFTDYASKLRVDYEREFRNALIQQNRGIISAFDMQQESWARLGLSDKCVGTCIPRPWPVRPGGAKMDACTEWVFRPGICAAVELPTLGAVALISKGHLSVVDAESLQLHYELQLDWLTHLIGISEQQERMHTKDWFDPTKASKKAKEKGTKAAKQALEAVGLVEHEAIPNAVGCAMEANGRLWMGCSTGHVCAVDVGSGKLEAAIDANLADTGNCITALAFSDASGSFRVWAGMSGGDIALLGFDSMAHVRNASHMQKLEQPDQLSKSTEVKSLLPSQDGTRIWAVYGKAGLACWDARDGSRFDPGQWIANADSDTTAAVIVGEELWIGYADSTIHIYDANNGKKVTVLMPYEKYAITSMATDGAQVWVAHVNGETRILDSNTRRAINVVANDQPTPVMLLAAPTRVSQMWTTAEDGSVRVWPTARTATPAPPTEAQQLVSRRPEYTKRGRVRARVMSWNVGDVQDAGAADLGSLLNSSQQNDLLVIGLQGAGIHSASLARMWQDAILAALSGYKLVQAAHYTGVLLFVVIVEKHEPYVSNVVVQTAGAELLKQDTGKAVAVHLLVHETNFTFINCMLSSNQAQCAMRNAEVKVLSKALIPTDQGRRVIWMGDLQYRIDLKLERLMEAVQVLGTPEPPSALALADRLQGGTVEFDIEVDAPLSLCTRVRGGDFVVAELPGMKIGALRKLALKEGIDGDQVDEAMEAPKPKDALISLLKALKEMEIPSRFASLDLYNMKMSELTELCEAEDIDEAKVDDAMEEDDPKNAVIKLLLELEKKRAASPSAPGSVAAAAAGWESQPEAKPKLASGGTNEVLAAAMQKQRDASPDSTVERLALEPAPTHSADGSPTRGASPTLAEMEAATAAQLAAVEAQSDAKIAAMEAEAMAAIALEEKIAEAKAASLAKIARAEAEADALRAETEQASISRVEAAKLEAAKAATQQAEAAEAAKLEAEKQRFAAEQQAAAAQSEVSMAAERAAKAAEEHAAARLVLETEMKAEMEERVRATEEEAAARIAAVEKAVADEKAAAAEKIRLDEEARLAEEARIVEEARLAEEVRLAEEARVAEEAKRAEEARRAEKRRLEEEEANRIAEGIPPGGIPDEVFFDFTDEEAEGDHAGDMPAAAKKPTQAEWEAAEAYKLRTAEVSVLLNCDQLSLERDGGRVFPAGDGWREPEIRFAPTYRFVPGTADYKTTGAAGDELPGWTGRILYRGEQVVYRQGTYTCATGKALGSHKPVMAEFAIGIAAVCPAKKYHIVKELRKNEREALASEKSSCSVELSGSELDLGTLLHGATCKRTFAVKNLGTVPITYCVVPPPQSVRWLSLRGVHGVVLPGAESAITLVALVDSLSANALQRCGGLMDAELSVFCMTARVNHSAQPRSTMVLPLRVTGRYNCKSMLGRSLDSLAQLPYPCAENTFRLRKTDLGFGMVLADDGSVSSFTSADVEAAKAGIGQGARIVRIGRTTVSSKADIISALGKAEGSTVDFTVASPGVHPGKASGEGQSPSIIRELADWLIACDYGQPGGTQPVVESVSGNIDFFVDGTASDQEVAAVHAVLESGQALGGLPPSFAPAVGRALVQILASLPRPVFPSVLLPLAGECGMQLDYERGVKLVGILAPTSKAVFNKCIALAKKLRERRGFELQVLAAGLAEGLMQVRTQQPAGAARASV